MSASSLTYLDIHRNSWRDDRLERTAFLLPKKRKTWTCPCIPSYPMLISSTLLLLASILTFAFLYGMRLPAPRLSPNPYDIKIWNKKDEINAIGKQMQALVEGKRILANIKWLADDIHIAGTPQNDKIIKKLENEYENMGYDVRIFPYDVLLNYPNFSHPNTVEVWDSGEWMKISKGFGTPKIPPKDDKSFEEESGVWWSAYSANGSAEGRIVYANYGFRHDFEHLAKVGINVKGSILLMRFGGVPRMVKVAEAEKRGAVGVILFSDPLHTGGHANKSFPFDMALPGDDVQRGGLLRTVGDPETPFLPSLPYVPRERIGELHRTGILPNIPVTPVGYDDATRIMKILDGKYIQEQRFIGGLNSDYRFTGSSIFRLSVSSFNSRRRIRNIIAIMKGREEPDKWVMLGNHVDAWVNGAIDPASGTATQLEVARAMAVTFKNFPPRRSIVFCHWDAEEFGLIGSSEWIEQMGNVLQSRALAMLNVDHVAGNETLSIKAVPLLYKVLSEAAERVEQTNRDERRAGRSNLLDTWKYYGSRSPIDGDKSLPEFGLPGGSSDHQRFISLAGIPTSDMKLSSSRKTSYSLYHSMHEVPWTVEHFLSPDGESFASLARLWIEAAHRLANNLVIPFSPTYYAQALLQWMSRLHTRFDHLDIPQQLPSYETRFRALLNAISKFRLEAERLETLSREITSGARSITPVEVERLNSRLFYLERSFIDRDAFSSPLHRHLVFSPSKYTTSRSPFSILLDAAQDWSRALPPEKDRILNFISMSLARVTHAIESATELLKMDDVEK